MVLIKTGNSNLKRLHKRLANTNARAVQINSVHVCLLYLLVSYLFICLFIIFIYFSPLLFYCTVCVKYY